MDERQMQHGVDYDGYQKIAGYVATEKYNGCRGYWDGSILWTRGGLQVRMPESWRESFPAGVHLDGEVYDGVDGLLRTVSAVRYGRFTETMRFMVFDCPSVAGAYHERVDSARKYESGPIQVVNYRTIKDITDAEKELKKIKASGGEGLMLRDDDHPYVPGRTVKIVKLKN